MLTLESTLVRVDELKPEKVEGIKKAAKAKLLQVAEAALGADTRLVIRDLLPKDLGYTNHEFPVTGGSDNDWTSILQGSAAATVADNVFVCITGVRILCSNGTNPFQVKPIITAMRITSGGSYVAQWDLHKLIAIAGATTAATAHTPAAGITEGPVIASQNITFNIETYAVETTDMQVIIEGYVCEKEGATLKP